MKLNFYQIGYVSIILTLFVFTIISLHQSNDSFDCNILFYLFIRVLLCVFTFLILQGSNPGYLNTKDLEEDVSNLVNNDINFIDDDFIYCSKCVSRRPLRSHHCHYCDQCVATYDHHCKVIGTCIGEGNHCRFYIFLFVNFISIILSISDIIQHRKLLNISMGDFSFFTLIIYWCYFTIVFLLFLVHSWLIITNTTSYELGKGSEKIKYLKGTEDCDLPFSKDKFTSKRWSAYHWHVPIIKPIEDTTICDNMWKNNVYSCC